MRIAVPSPRRVKGRICVAMAEATLAKWAVASPMISPPIAGPRHGEGY
jgi:hypothetical protein